MHGSMGGGDGGRGEEGGRLEAREKEREERDDRGCGDRGTEDGREYWIAWGGYLKGNTEEGGEEKNNGCRNLRREGRRGEGKVTHAGKVDRGA